MTHTSHDRFRYQASKVLALLSRPSCLSKLTSEGQQISTTQLWYKQRSCEKGKATNYSHVSSTNKSYGRKNWYRLINLYISL